MDMLITNGHVVTMDDELGDVPSADMRDGEIAAVGPGHEHAERRAPS
jgi:predicted amidohydrolase YtcJ